MTQSLFPWLTDSHFLLVSSDGFSLVYLHSYFLLIKAPVILDWSFYMILFNHNSFFKGLISKNDYILRYSGLEIQHMNLGETHLSP